MKRILVSMVTICVACAAGAAEYFVDAAAPAGGVGTKERPFATIQDAVDKAAANDVITVAAGVYATGGALSSDCGSRVRIDGKPGLRLRGAGRGKSFIVGSRDPEAEGYSLAATNALTGVVRCLHVTSSDGAIVSGFTLRDGETLDDGAAKADATNCGGAVYADSTDVYVVDCDLSHSSARYGAATYGATLVRCVADDCYGMRGPGGMSCRMVNCVVSRPRQSAGNVGAVYGSSVYNTTIGDSGCFWALQGKSKAWNSLFVTYSNNKILERECYDEEDSEVVDSVRPTVAPKDHWQVLGPAVGDWRLLPDSDAIGAGDPAWLSALSLPEGIDAFTDVLGARITANASGRINAGAVQAVVAPAGGALVFNGVVEIDGRRTRNRFLTWAYPSSYPVQYCVKAVLGPGEHLYRLARLDPTGSLTDDLPAMVPYKDSSMWMMPPPDVSLRVTNRFDLARKVLWVDPENGTAAGDGTEDNPFDTIPKAIGQLTKSQYSVIYLKPGVYTNDAIVEANGRGNFRVVLSDTKYCVRIVSTDGAEKTIIRGAPDPDTEGKGTNAVKGVCLTGLNQIIQGVTFADCYSSAESGGSSPYGAAAYPFSKNNPVFADCVITNCHANKGIIANPVVLYRCRAYDSTASTSTCPFNGGAAFACYTRGVESTVTGTGATGIFGNSAQVYQSTLTTQLGKGRLTGSGNVSYNSIWYGGLNIYSLSVFTNCFVYNPKGDAQGTYEKTDPLFVDVTKSGELLAASPAIGAGGSMTATEVGADYWRYACGDIDGRPIRFDANGRATLGAFQTAVVKRVVVDEPSQGGWRLKDGAYGTRDLREDETFAVEVEFDPGTRPCVGVTCSGRTYSFADATTVQVSIPYGELDATAELRGIYTTDWYVDDDGDDANHGFWPEKSKKTLCTAAAAIAAGDTLHVLPGVYTNGSVKLSDTCTTLSRLLVAGKTSVVSTEGPEKTFILGADAPADADPASGCGINAVRCAYVEEGGVLSGFTLAGGRVNLFDTLREFPYDSYGSAVLGAGRGKAMVENCIISNGYAQLGSVALCDAANCRFIGNTTASHGSGVRQGNAYGCLFDGNCGAVVISYPLRVWNCTVLCNNTESESSAKVARCVDNALAEFEIFNCFFGGRLMADDSLGTIRNVIAATDSNVDALNEIVDLRLVDTSSYAFDAQGVPVIGANEGIDAGFVLVNTNGLGSVDLNGNPRVQNGRMDIGCCEADWRDEYARRIGRPSWFAVTAADGSAHTNGAGQVCLPTGAFVSQVSNPGQTATFAARVEVVGTGVLQVQVNGSVVATQGAPGTYDIPFSAPLDVNELVFAFTPASDASGEVKIHSVRRNIGLLLIVR